MSVVKRFDVNREQATLYTDIYDVSAQNDGAVFESLSSLLNNIDLDTLIPLAVRKGGMSIKFIQGSVSNSDNKYVQYRLTKNTWSVRTDDWNIVEGNSFTFDTNFVYAKIDKKSKILYAIKSDGGFYFGEGCPQQVKDFVNDISATKLDKEGLDSDALKSIKHITGNIDYVQATIDNEKKILEGISANGNKQINIPIETPSFIKEHKINPIWISVITDKEGKILEGITNDGVKKTFVPAEIEGTLNKDDFFDFYKNEKHQWSTKTVISYKKPGVAIDNIHNFDNLMQACYYAYERASVMNQYDIEVYEDIYATEESEFDLIPHHPANSREWACLFYTNDFIRIRGIGYPKVISARMNKLTFTTNRTFFNTGFYHGGELENIIVIAENVKYAVHWENNHEYTRDTTGLIRECEFIHYGGNNELWGNETEQYQSWNAWGCGFSEGCKIQFEKCKLISYTNFAFSTHGNGNTRPVEINFDSCHLIGGRYGLIVQHPLTGTDKLAVKLTNNFISGGESDITYWNGTAVNQINVRIYGANNTFSTFYGTSDKTFLLTPVADDVNCRLLQDDAGVFGDFIETDAEFGIKSHIIGSSGLLDLNRRVGDCSVYSKTLSIKFGNNTINVVFEQDYSNVSNEDILDFINSTISEYGTITEDIIARYYYPEFSDVVVYKKNTGNSVISFGDYAAINGINVEKLLSSENADCICIEQFGVGVGQIGKFRTNL